MKSIRTFLLSKIGSICFAILLVVLQVTEVFSQSQNSSSGLPKTNPLSTCVKQGITVTPGSSNDGVALDLSYSPSITEYNPNGDGMPTVDVLLCAFAFTKQDNSGRSVGISSSTDGGATWAVRRGVNTPLPFPKWDGTSSALTNMDDPQIISRGKTIVLVVRAWGGITDQGNSNFHNDFRGENGVDGSHDPDQPGTVFQKVGIYLTVSTNGGTTWGYFDNSNTFHVESSTSNPWKKIAENPNYGSSVSSMATTLEWPRVAWRNDYSQDPGYGYVVWEKKVWSYNSNTDDLTVHSTASIGIAAFDLYGRIQSNPTSGNATPYFTNGSCSFSMTERPSVAIAPDGSAWIAYYKINFSSPNATDVMAGNVRPYMSIFYTRAIYTGGTTPSFSVECPQELVNHQTMQRLACGYYDKLRGYLYFSDYNIDLAAGPSIQVACEKQSYCRPSYHLGILSTYGINGGGDDDNTAGTMFYHNHLGFNCARVFYNESAATVNATTIDATNLNSYGGWVYATDHEVETDWMAGDAASHRTFFFPVLKYTFVRDEWINPDSHTGNVVPTGGGEMDAPSGSSQSGVSNIQLFAGDLHVIRSYFLLAYFGAEEEDVGGDIGHDFYPSGQVEVGVAFDNEKFTIRNYAASRNIGLVVGAEYNDFSPGVRLDAGADHLGCKLDVCGNYTGGVGYSGTGSTGFFVHLVWKEVIPQTNFDPPSVWRLKAMNGKCILVKGYVSGWPLGYDDAFITGTSSGSSGAIGPFLKTNLDNDYAWGDYGYFDFNNCDVPIDRSAVYPTTISAKPSIVTQDFGTVYSQGFIPSIGSTIKPGLYYAVYAPSSGSTVVGALEYSDQRKLVATDAIVHSVFTRDNKAYYSLYGNTTQATNPDWSVPELLNSVPSSIKQYRPSIAVYEESVGTTQPSTGSCAIGVTWVEIQPAPSIGNTWYQVDVKLRVREFDECSDKWNSWSPVYTVHTHYFDKMKDMYGAMGPGDDATTPVIAPLQSPAPANDLVSGGISTLTGWTVTWTGPQFDPNTLRALSTPVTCPAAGGKLVLPHYTALYSRTWLRANSLTGALLTNNSNWGEVNPGYPTSSAGNVKWQPLLGANDIFAIAPLDKSPCNTMQPIGFPSVVSLDFKKTGSQAEIRQEVAFTHGNDANWGPGVFIGQMTYRTLSGTIGSLAGATFGSPLNPTNPSPLYKGVVSATNTWTRFDRNPCITINSTGQRFVSWEHLDALYNPKAAPATNYFSSIITANTSFAGSWSPGNIQYRVSEPALDQSWNWLLNPSIAGFPRTPTINTVAPQPAFSDQDPGTVLMVYWQKQQMTSPVAAALVNNIYNTYYSEPALALNGAGGVWTGSITPGAVKPSWSALTAGTNSQQVFGPFTTGPAYQAGSLGLTFRSSFAFPFGLANSAGSPNQFVTAQYATLKLGTFDSALGVNLLRSETRLKDSGLARFIWGNVWVEDSSNGMTPRQVIMHWGTPDSNGFVNHDAMRDSIFRTELFDWPVSAEISYYRGAFLEAIDSITQDYSFYDPSVRMQYTFELVHTSGQVDTLETVVFAPSTQAFAEPGIIHLANANSIEDSVFIRVRGVLTGIPDEDSLCSFECEDMYGLYPTYFDSTLVSSKQPFNPVTNLNMQGAGPYPNPCYSNSNNLTILAKCAQNGAPITATVFDYLGNAIGFPSTVLSDGQWQKIQISCPSNSGAYYIQVVGAGDQVVLPMTVL